MNLPEALQWLATQRGYIDFSSEHPDGEPPFSEGVSGFSVWVKHPDRNYGAPCLRDERFTIEEELADRISMLRWMMEANSA